MSTWALPDHVSDILPSQARQVEEIRRKLLDKARCYGFELIIPPLIEHLESLLTGTGASLDLYTFKLVDQISGRLLGVRADTTPQAARMDAHLLYRQGVSRLCYCCSTLHAKAQTAWSDREQLQFGAEIFGHKGLEAELEILQLTLSCLRDAGLKNIVLDLSHAGLICTMMDAAHLNTSQKVAIGNALAIKDKVTVAALCADLTPEWSAAFTQLPAMYGSIDQLQEVRNQLPPLTEIKKCIDELLWLADHLQEDIKISFDLADAKSYSYYTGLRFSFFSPSSKDALARGGRYDDVGVEFGRPRPACGMSLDLRSLLQALSPIPSQSAIRSPWLQDKELQKTVENLRKKGEVVINILPNEECKQELDEFHCDRELVLQNGAWTVTMIK